MQSAKGEVEQQAVPTWLQQRLLQRSAACVTQLAVKPLAMQASVTMASLQPCWGTIPWQGWQQLLSRPQMGLQVIMVRLITRQKAHPQWYWAETHLLGTWLSADPSLDEGFACQPDV